MADKPQNHPPPPSDLPKTRVCSKCGKRRPIHKFYQRWRWNRDKTSRYYSVEGDCKECRIQKVGEWTEKNHDKTSVYKRKWYERNKDWWTEKRSNDPEWLAKRKAYEREYYRENLIKKRKQAREWVQKNPERARENAVRWYELNKEKVCAQSQKWAAANPEIVAVNRHKRRASEKQTRKPLTGEQWADILDDYEGMCFVCGSPDRITLDHLIPLSRGGEHSKRNCRPLCWSCNSSKRDSKLTEWLPKRARYLANKGWEISPDEVILRLKRERASYE